MTAEAVLVEAGPPGLLEVREGLSRDRVVGARRRPLQRIVVDRVDGTGNGLADGGVARSDIFVSHETARVLNVSRQRQQIRRSQGLHV